MLMNIEKKYPGMTEFSKISGISAQAQTKHAIRTVTDQHGEQTINKDAKSTGNSVQSSSHTNTANKYTTLTTFNCVEFRA